MADDRHARGLPAAGGGARPSASGRRHWPRPRRPPPDSKTDERRALAAAALVVVTGRAALPLIAQVRSRCQPGGGRRAWNRSRAAGARFPNRPGGAAHRGDAQSGKRARDAARSAFRRGRFGVAPDLCGQPHARSRDGRARARNRRTASAGGSRVIRWRSRSPRAGRVLRPGGCRRPCHAAGDLRNGSGRSVGARAPGRRHDDRCDSGSGRR